MGKQTKQKPAPSTPEVKASEPSKPKADEKKAPPRIAVDDRPWKLAKLAATLSSNLELKERSISGLAVNTRLAAREFDPYFAAALKRADDILSWAEGKGGDIHAYQIFEEGSKLTENQIVEGFKRVSWPGLKTKQPIMDLMRDVLSLFEDELRAEEESYQKIIGIGVPELQSALKQAIITAFEKHACCKIQKADHQTQHIVEDLTAPVDERLYEHFAQGESVEHFFHLREEQAFLAWCFPDPPPGSRAERLYRPHEIFRRCASRGWFIEKLIRPRENMNSSFIPFPPEDSHIYGRQKPTIGHRMVKAASKTSITIRGSRVSTVS